MTVTRKKREVPKKVNKQVIDGIKNVVDKSNKEFLAAQGNGRKGEGAADAQAKKRRHEILHSSPFNPGTSHGIKGKNTAPAKKAQAPPNTASKSGVVARNSLLKCRVASLDLGYC